MNNPALKVLIVDDEPLARHWMRMQLNKCSIAVEIAEAASAALAVNWLAEHTCDVILLDIHMPETNGLEFAQNCPKNSSNPAVIFVTADASHALQAFELAAFDYLTKPVSVERLEQALQRAVARMPPPAIQNEPVQDDMPFITVESHQQLSRISLSDILYFQAESKYVRIATKNQSHLIENSLNTLEQQFEGFVIRVHRSYLVTLHAIEKLVRGVDESVPQDTWFIQIQGAGARIPVSRRQLPLVKELLHQ